jgi:hypothetical protein
MNQVGPAWGPRPPKSAFRLWSRYVFQWVWGPLYAIGMVLAPLINEILNAVHDASGRPRTRPARRIWLSRDRLRRERNTDLGQVEVRLRERLAHPAPAAAGRAGAVARTLQVDDSYFRQIGATRALQIAGEYGWHLPEDTARYAPKWLVLRRPAEAHDHHHQQQHAIHSPYQAQQPHWQAPSQQQGAGAAGSYAPIPADRHSIAGEIGERIRLWGSMGGQEVDLARVVVPPGATEKADKSSRPPFKIYGGTDGGLLCSVQPAGHETYELFAADGTPLARITRRPGRVLLGPRRVRWTVQASGTTQPVTGKVGTWYSWLSYYVFAPLWVPFWLCMVVYTLLSGDGDDMRVVGPSRTLWRSQGSGSVIEYRGVNKVYHLEPRHVDFRVAYAQCVLHSRDR